MSKVIVGRNDGRCFALTTGTVVKSVYFEREEDAEKFLNNCVADRKSVKNGDFYIDVRQDELMRYGVFDNNKPASKQGFPQLKGKGWENHIFGTFEAAVEYANEWLGAYGGVELQLDTPYYYSYSDNIVIRLVP